jgi:tetratricopeptide (TPR) repeat protein
MRSVDNERLVFHPLVRTLLLRQLPADGSPESDYHRVHTSLKNYFHTLANQQRGTQSQEAARGQARIEEAYHALALGDPNPAIALGIFAQQRNLTLWEPLLEAVAQASVELKPDDVEHQAYNALVRAIQHHGVQDAVEAIILYTWLLSTSEGEPIDRALTQNNLGIAYSDLPGGDRQANLRQAIACYEAALQVYTREAFPADWAMTQNNLGIAYSPLPGGDRQANLKRAIAFYEAALRVLQLAHVDYYASVVSENIEMIREELHSLEQEGSQEHEEV